MKKILWLLMLMGNLMFIRAQHLYIEGKVYSSEKKAVEHATVYLLKEKDSSIINYTATNKEGKFSLKTDELKEHSILKIDAEKLTSYFKKFEKISSPVSLGDIELKKNQVVNIDEIKISVAPIKIKKDTIEFNASFLKVRPDSKIDELLKQIPGVEISNDKKITVNGKEVDQVMINGKPFFDKTGKIALQNLPADIIRNIQFTTSKTKEEELSGNAPQSNKVTVNFNIDEKKNKGLLSRLTLGYGSDNRYEGSGFVNYFKKDTKISLLASSNNINSQGFSNDEVFDSMGYARNSSILSSGNDSPGIQKSTTIGFNYSDKLSKDTDLNTLSLIYSNSDTESQSKGSRSTLLPGYTLKNNSESNGKNEFKQYNFETTADIKIDSLTHIYFSPTFTRTESFSISRSSSSTLRDGILLNDSNSYNTTGSEDNTFTPSIQIYRKLKKKGNMLSFEMNSTITESKRNSINTSQNRFYQGTDANDDRNQLSKNKIKGNEYQFSAGYSRAVSDSVKIGINIRYSAKQNGNLRDVYDFDPTTETYSVQSVALSNSMEQKINQVTPEVSFNLIKHKLYISATAHLNISDMKINSVYNNTSYALQKNFVLPGYVVNAQYSLSENNSLRFYNSSMLTIPGMEQLTPYLDTSNPFITYTGNPNLKNTWTNNSSLYFYNYNFIKNTNYFFNIDFGYRNNDIANYSRYDNSGKQLVTYNNISGNKSIGLRGSYSKNFKWKENKLMINPRFIMQYYYNKGFINGQLFTTHSYTFNSELSLTYELKDKITVKPSYKIGYNFSKYNNYSIDKVSATSQSLQLELTNYLFKSNLLFGNDFEYNTNSTIASGFKRDFYFWNTSLGYSFYKKQFTAKVKIYDVLNQNQSVKRTITNSYFEDREDLILKRYIMFSLSMSLNKFAEKK
ncbi:outer membrane beta-barrel protein [Chryseobacterium sp.]|uniref:outer membrane beta-barrel protein n=1 Tax=Chryseobacterium sp. TaxID=1871047 RepID=UPI0025BB4387|nr:outer membrane beta-barrel protein [Chryseobacterium sp.]MBV8328693.1 outer membrane beta-barrel protein [Chryseobacterium sp.]